MSAQSNELPKHEHSISGGQNLYACIDIEKIFLGGRLAKNLGLTWVAKTQAEWRCSVRRRRRRKRIEAALFSAAVSGYLPPFAVGATKELFRRATVGDHSLLTVVFQSLTQTSGEVA